MKSHRLLAHAGRLATASRRLGAWDMALGVESQPAPPSLSMLLIMKGRKGDIAFRTQLRYPSELLPLGGLGAGRPSHRIHEAYASFPISILRYSSFPLSDVISTCL